MKRPQWLPRLSTLSQLVAIFVAVATLAGLRGARHAVADVVHWLAHPVDTPRVVFVLVLVLAAAAGLILLAAFWRRLFRSGARDTPRRRAEDFRSAWERLADHLRRWREESDISERDTNRQEQYRDLRRGALEAYARVQDDFRHFLDQNRAWDLREPLVGELVGVEVVGEDIEDPFGRLWEFDNLLETMYWVRAMTPTQLSAWIGRRNDALSAFVTWTHDH